MPGMNGKGPLGNGPQTGGQRGVCKQTGAVAPDQPPGAAVDAVPDQGQTQGLGRCQGGAGRGGGRCGGGKGQGGSGKR